MTNWIIHEDGSIEPKNSYWSRTLSPTSFRKWDNRTKEYKFIKCGSDEHKKMMNNRGGGQRVICNPILVPKEISDRWYLSDEWKNCRKKYLRNYRKTQGLRVCNHCGTTEEHIKMHIDHIYPVRRYWAMRLDQNNLQNLCEVCNSQKGNYMDNSIAERRLIKKDGRWVILEVKQEPFICPDWLKNDVAPDWKEEEQRNKNKLELISHKKINDIQS